MSFETIKSKLNKPGCKIFDCYELRRKQEIKCEWRGGFAEVSALFIQFLLFRPSQGEKAGPPFTQLLFLKTQLSRPTQLPHSASV